MRGLYSFDNFFKVKECYINVLSKKWNDFILAAGGQVEMNFETREKGKLDWDRYNLETVSIHNIFSKKKKLSA